MFDWFGKAFGRRSYNTDMRTDMEKIADDMKKVLPPIPAPPEPKRDQIAYKIGKTEEGKVTLSIGDHGAIVTMNNQGVDQLIRMLEAAKDPVKEPEENPVD